MTTPAGGWNEPTRFLPSLVFSPVFPPMAASTIASTVVGMCTTLTPRSHVAAMKPPMSLVAPPPIVMTASDLVKSAWPRICQQKAATSMRFAPSASGISAMRTWLYSPTSCSRTRSATFARCGACTIRTLATPSPSRAGTTAAASLNWPVPMMMSPWAPGTSMISGNVAWSFLGVLIQPLRDVLDNADHGPE